MAVVVPAAPYRPVPPKNHLMGCCHHASSERQAEMGLATRKDADTRGMGAAGAGSGENELVCKGPGLGMSPRMERAGDAREMTNTIVVLVEGCKEKISGQ